MRLVLSDKKLFKVYEGGKTTKNNKPVISHEHDNK